MTAEQMQERMKLAQAARAARKRKISEAMGDLLGEQARQERLMGIRHQNERADLAAVQEAEVEALLAKEKEATDAAAKEAATK